MVESQRKQTSGKPVLEGNEHSLHDKLTLVGFLFGAIGIVAGMFWLANGLSQNFELASATFITFAVGMSIMIAVFLVNKFVVKE